MAVLRKKGLARNFSSVKKANSPWSHLPLNYKSIGRHEVVFSIKLWFSVRSVNPALRKQRDGWVEEKIPDGWEEISRASRKNEPHGHFILSQSAAQIISVFPRKYQSPKVHSERLTIAPQPVFTLNAIEFVESEDIGRISQRCFQVHFAKIY